ncbi:gp561 [Bacillus phage G]|uniref:Gp561 n=1 Tax=Bacillus phage G TaxID=2884420 RepID=G3MAU1_9CAUD|nr:gp561 [Bacillus phage G]AEO93807.1 gp561 [Bacillus phage G]
MERSNEMLKSFVVDLVRQDHLYKEENLVELENAIDYDEKLSGPQKETLTRILSESAASEMEKMKKKDGAVLLLEIDVLSMYSDAYGLFCMRG